jgi:hypothetical protein
LALTKRAVDKISCSPGVKSVAGTDSEFNNANRESRCLGHFDEDLNAPSSYPLSGLPTGRKISDAGASALIKGYKDKKISTVDVSAESSNNAPNAKVIRK